MLVSVMGVIHPQLTTNPDLMTDHPGIFRQLLLTEQQLGVNLASFEGELGQVIYQTVPFHRDLSGSRGW